MSDTTGTGRSRTSTTTLSRVGSATDPVGELRRLPWENEAREEKSISRALGGSGSRLLRVDEAREEKSISRAAAGGGSRLPCEAEARDDKPISRAAVGGGR